jgi:hypothetical protein
MTKLLQHIEEMRARLSEIANGERALVQALNDAFNRLDQQLLGGVHVPAAARPTPGARGAGQTDSKSASSVRGAGGRPSATSLHLEAREAVGLVSHKADRTLRPLPQSSPLLGPTSLPLSDHDQITPIAREQVRAFIHFCRNLIRRSGPSREPL